MAAKLRLADLLGGLSLVADLGYGLSPGHAMRSCLVGVALARQLGLAEREVAEVFYTSLLSHIGCATFSHEMSAAFGDELSANRAGARTNFADPKDVLITLIPESTRGMPLLARARTASFIVTRGRSLGRRYDSTVCEIARETARRIGLADGVQAALFEVKEAWNGSGAPQGLKGDQILIPARITRLASEAALFYDLGVSDSRHTRCHAEADPCSIPRSSPPSSRTMRRCWVRPMRGIRANMSWLRNRSRSRRGTSAIFPRLRRHSEIWWT